MRAALAATVFLVVMVAASPAPGQSRSVDVQMTAHLVSDYRFTYDWVDTVNDPECPATYKGSSRVVTDMTTVRPARFRIERTRSRGRTVFLLTKRLGGGQRGTRSIDMRARMTRSTQGGSETPCFGYHPFPSDKCGTRSWELDGAPSVGAGEFHIGLDVPVIGGIEQMMADAEWRRGGCGYDTTNADEYVTSLDDGQGNIKPSYTAPLSIRRLFRPGRRTLRLRDSHAFTVGRANQLGGTSTEVRTVEATIRKLR